MSEGFAAQDQSLRGLLGLVHLVPGRLGVLHLRQLHVFTNPVKLLLGVLELTDIPEGGKRDKKKLYLFDKSQGSCGFLFTFSPTLEYAPLSFHQFLIILCMRYIFQLT